MTHEPTPAEVRECLARIAASEIDGAVACACQRDDWADVRAEALRQERRAENWKQGFVLLAFFAVTLFAALGAVIWRLTR